MTTNAQNSFNMEQILLLRKKLHDCPESSMHETATKRLLMDFVRMHTHTLEGSRLTEDQTRLIFETNTIDVGDGIPVDDILETVHHFRAIAKSKRRSWLCCRSIIPFRM